MRLNALERLKQCFMQKNRGLVQIRLNAKKKGPERGSKLGARRVVRAVLKNIELYIPDPSATTGEICRK